VKDRSETHQTWALARDLFLDLVELDEGARDDRLRVLATDDPELHERVAKLLAHDRPAPAHEPPSRRFGPYRPLKKIGSGGMGEVWLGKRDDGEFEREVAIKVLRLGLGGEEVVRRFQRERQLLATLDHEYISRLIDGGTTDRGLPYLVLEYVDGAPLDAYCQDRALEPKEKLELFLKVLAAVSHAHDRGVIHRDLKPGNILVRADGTPRLLDFGISRIRDDEASSVAPLTRVGHRLFTPEYASPEQIRGALVTEATDIFSLGVILHELLTGSRPWPKGLDDAALERAILESHPAPPSRCVDTKERRELVGDLDTIVEKCLRKEPWARYANVRELIDDLERHLTGRSIRARRTGVFERVARGVRRRPFAVIGAVVVLVTGIVAYRIHRERVEERAGFLRATSARLEGAIGLREQGRVDESMKELEAVITALDDRRDTAAMRARAHTHFAIGANHGRRFGDALSHLDVAAPLLSPTDEASKTLYASYLNARAYASSESGDVEAGLAIARDAITFCRANLPPGDPRTIDALLELADRRRKGVPTQEDLDNIDAVVEEARLRGNPRDATLGSAINLAAVVRTDAFLYEEAIELYEEAIEVLGWHHGEGQEPIAFLRSNLGDAWFRLGRLEEAKAQHERALATRRALGERRYVAISLEYLARVAIDLRDFDRALALLTEARSIVNEVLGNGHALARRNRLWLAILEVERGNVEAGCVAIEREVASHGASNALPLLHEAEGRLRLGRSKVVAGDVEAGRVELERALRVFENELGPRHRHTLAARALLDAK
jgi:tetratricopeptide (TPR) repeat protein